VILSSTDLAIEQTRSVPLRADEVLL